MSLKRKLIISYMLSVIIPLVIIGFLAISLNFTVRSFISTEFTGDEKYNDSNHTHFFQQNFIDSLEAEPSLSNNV